MKEKNELDMLRNADNGIVDRLADMQFLSDKEKERMYKMSTMKLNALQERAAGIEMNAANEDMTVRGTEVYRKPVWFKPAVTAAACLVTVLGLTGAAFLLKGFRGGDDGDIDAPPPVMASTTGTQTETETSEVTTSAASVSSTVTTVLTTKVIVTSADAEDVTEDLTEAAPSAVEPVVSDTTYETTDTTEPADNNDAQRTETCKGITAEVFDKWKQYMQFGTEEKYIDYSDSFNVYQVSDEEEITDTATYYRYNNPYMGSKEDYISYVYSILVCDWYDLSHHAYRQFSEDLYPEMQIKDGITFPKKFCMYDGKLYAMSTEGTPFGPEDIITLYPDSIIITDLYSEDYYNLDPVSDEQDQTPVSDRFTALLAYDYYDQTAGTHEKCYTEMGFINIDGNWKISGSGYVEESEYLAAAFR